MHLPEFIRFDLSEYHRPRYYTVKKMKKKKKILFHNFNGCAERLFYFLLYYKRKKKFLFEYGIGFIFPDTMSYVKKKTTNLTAYANVRAVRPSSAFGLSRLIRVNRSLLASARDGSRSH